MKKILLLCSIALLTACNPKSPTSSVAVTEASPAAIASPTIAPATEAPAQSVPSSPTPTALPARSTLDSSDTSAASEFSFPQASCGDAATSADDTWYPVFIDGGDLAQVRKQYCADAVATVREATGAKTVQLASFTSKEKALRFAHTVNGEVGTPSTPVAATSPEPSTPSQPESAVSSSSTSSSGSGNCDYSWQTDSAGRRCGDRAAEVRPGGNLGGSGSSYIPSGGGSVYVHPYTRRDGTYVRGHSRRR